MGKHAYIINIGEISKMKVKDLIKILQSCPDEAIILVGNEEFSDDVEVIIKEKGLQLNKIYHGYYELDGVAVCKNEKFIEKDGKLKVPVVFLK